MQNKKEQYTGHVEVRPRGYYVFISPLGESEGYDSHKAYFTQKKVKEMEKVTGLEGQELADLLASNVKEYRKSKGSSNYNDIDKVLINKEVGVTGIGFPFRSY